MKSDAKPTEFRSLIVALKALLKSRKITYAAISQQLGVSEQTIKRLFTSEDGSIGRVTEICRAIGITFFDLVKFASEEREKIFHLTSDQEQHFCDYPSDYGLLTALLKNEDPLQYATRKKIHSKTLNDMLRRLETIDLIERHPGGVVVVLVTGTHNWLHGGPMQRKYLEKSGIEFLKHLVSMTGPSFPKENHFVTTSERRLTAQTIRELTLTLQDTFREFRHRAQFEESMVDPSALHDVRWFCGLAPYPNSFDREC